MSGHLRRHLAPIGDSAWAAIEEEATRTLRHHLAARPLVDFQGPRGWDWSAADLGRVDDASTPPGTGVEGRLRRVLPVAELRTPFTLERSELDAVDRGAADPDLDPGADAARRAAEAEDKAVFYGWHGGGVTGVAEASPHPALSITDDYNDYPSTVAKAVAELRGAGVGGPYGIALGPRCYTGVVESTEHGGYPVLEHIRLILGGPIVWAPAVDGAVVVSLRGGDYSFECGQDFSIGYAGHTATTVELYLEESFAFRVIDHKAAVALRYPA
ncbi:MAG TPA: family 1 encapsulin nanocompartment shell protein [Acidimicrobiales bacterium]|nr:family 1 encapsulin nanocompartment shell protein [Acidimicrobiales bacterium]